MTEIARRGEAALLLGLQYRQGVGEDKFKIQDLTPNSTCDPSFYVTPNSTVDP